MIDIKLKDITFVFEESGKQVRLFSSFDLNIEKGELVCIFGPSGCGKSTLLKIISGILIPQKGIVRVSGKSPKNIGVKIGVVFQEPRLFSWMTAEKNIEFTAKHIFNNTGYIRKRVKYALRLVKAQGLARRLPGTLSGGEAQRMSLARAITINPQALLLDEPFSHLDELSAQNLREMFLRVAKNMKTTTVFVTHNPNEAVYLADRIVVMKRHRVSRIIADLKVKKRKRKELSYQNFFAKKQNVKAVKELVALL